MIRIKWLLMSLALLGSLCIINTSLFAKPLDKVQKVKIDEKEVYRLGVAIGQIKELYIENVSDHEIFSNAIEGILTGLDPHSSYLDENELKMLDETSNGEFSGLGIEVTLQNRLLTVIAPIDDTPAAKAGIKAGDIILAIDGKPLTTISLDKMIQKLRGKKGTKVILTIIHKDGKAPENLTIKRDIIPIDSAKGRLLTPNYGYLRISHFQEDTFKDAKNTIIDLQKTAENKKLNGLIVDLRNNPGGILDSASNVTDLFLDSNSLKKNKLIVYTKGRVKEANTNMDATPGDILHGAPIVVLINHGSASGAEIMAGALQDHHRALIVGQQSFGKGSVQSILALDRDTALKLTTALYYTPNDRSIQADGISPDIKLPDLTVDNANQKNPLLFDLSERALDQHLKGKNEKDGPIKTDYSMTKLAKEDFQLYEALQILKSMSFNQQ